MKNLISLRPVILVINILSLFNVYKEHFCKTTLPQCNGASAALETATLQTDGSYADVIFLKLLGDSLISRQEHLVCLARQ